MKTILFSVATFVAGLLCGTTLADKATHNFQEEYEFLKEANSYKYNLLRLYEKKDSLTNELFWKHDLYDKDGSDLMYEHMVITEKIDSMYRSEL